MTSRLPAALATDSHRGWSQRCGLHEFHCVSLSQLLTAKPPDAEEICKWLAGIGPFHLWEGL